MVFLKKLDDNGTVIVYNKGSQKKSQRLNRQVMGPLKAGTALLLYNFMESVSCAMMRDIYSNLSDKHQQYQLKLSDIHVNLRDKILSYFHTTVSSSDALQRSLSDYISGKTTIDEIILASWFEQQAELSKSDTTPSWFNGNVDVEKITKIAKKYNFNNPSYEKMKNRNKRASSLVNIKNSRNKLAHGAQTFSDYGNTKTLTEIEADFKNILAFFHGLLGIVNHYIENANYLECSDPLPLRA